MRIYDIILHDGADAATLNVNEVNFVRVNGLNKEEMEMLSKLFADHGAKFVVLPATEG